MLTTTWRPLRSNVQCSFVQIQVGSEDQEYKSQSAKVEHRCCTVLGRFWVCVASLDKWRWYSDRQRQEQQECSSWPLPIWLVRYLGSGFRSQAHSGLIRSNVCYRDLVVLRMNLRNDQTKNRGPQLCSPGVEVLLCRTKSLSSTRTYPSKRTPTAVYERTS